MSVPSTRKISIVASHKFCNPNWIGVYAILKTKFKKKGMNEAGGSFFCQIRKRIYPKLIAIPI
jgi:hypothetical protein